MARPRWEDTHPELAARALELAAQGVGVRAIARQLGVSRNTLRLFLVPGAREAHAARERERLQDPEHREARNARKRVENLTPEQREAKRKAQREKRATDHEWREAVNASRRVENLTPEQREAKNAKAKEYREGNRELVRAVGRASYRKQMSTEEGRERRRRNERNSTRTKERLFHQSVRGYRHRYLCLVGAEAGVRATATPLRRMFQDSIREAKDRLFCLEVAKKYNLKTVPKHAKAARGVMWRKENPAKWQKALKTRNERNPDKYIHEKGLRRRAAEKNAPPGLYNPLLKRQLYSIQEGRCAYCDKYTKLTDMTTDHVIPFARGGSDGAENRVLACRPCNCYSKGALTPHEFKPESSERVALILKLALLRATRRQED